MATPTRALSNSLVVPLTTGSLPLDGGNGVVRVADEALEQLRVETPPPEDPEVPQGRFSWLRGVVGGVVDRVNNVACDLAAGTRDRVVGAVTALGQGVFNVGARTLGGARYYAGVAAQTTYDAAYAVAAPRLKALGDMARGRWDGLMADLSGRYHAFDARRTELEARIRGPLRETVRMLADTVGESIEETPDYVWYESFLNYLPEGYAARAKAGVKKIERDLLYDVLLIAAAKLLDRVETMPPEQWQGIFDKALEATDKHLQAYVGLHRDVKRGLRRSHLDPDIQSQSFVREFDHRRSLFAFPEGGTPELRGEYDKIFFRELFRQVFDSIKDEVVAELPALGTGLGVPSIAGYVLSFDGIKRRLSTTVPDIIGKRIVGLIAVALEPTNMQTLVTKVSTVLADSLDPKLRGTEVLDPDVEPAEDAIPIDVSGHAETLGRVVLNLAKFPNIRMLDRLMETARGGARLFDQNTDAMVGNTMAAALDETLAKGKSYWIDCAITNLNEVLVRLRAEDQLSLEDRDAVRQAAAEDTNDSFIAATDRVAAVGVRHVANSTWERVTGYVKGIFSSTNGFFSKVKGAAKQAYRTFSYFYDGFAQRVYVLEPILRIAKAFVEGITMASADLILFILKQFRNHVLYSPLILGLVDNIRKLFGHCSNRVQHHVAQRLAVQVRRGTEHLSHKSHSHLLNLLVADLLKGVFPEEVDLDVDVAAIHAQQTFAEEQQQQAADQEAEADLRLEREFLDRQELVADEVEEDEEEEEEFFELPTGTDEEVPFGLDS